MDVKAALLLLFLMASPLLFGQTTPPEITNSDVSSMTKAGIGERTIILAIQHGPVKFDTSPKALIALKAARVSDPVLNAMLEAATERKSSNQAGENTDGEVLFRKVLDAIGQHDKIMAVHSLRRKANDTVSARGTTMSFLQDELRVFPDDFYLFSIPATGPSQKQIITADFGYKASGLQISAIAADDLAVLREEMEFSSLAIAQHPDDYAVSSMVEQQPNIGKLQISRSEHTCIWEIDLQTGHLLSSDLETPKGNIVEQFSDYRSLYGLSLPFKIQANVYGNTVDSTVQEYEINPTIVEGLFKRPSENKAGNTSQVVNDQFKRLREEAAGNTSQALTLKVSQSQSIPYTQQFNSGISTSCSIVGTSNTSAYASAYGNSASGNATTNSNQHMNCNSYDTTQQWPHILNVMFAQASDGNSYIIACDRAWYWSKCVPLRAGEVYSAHFTEKGIQVQAVNSKGKAVNPTYHVLQSKASQ